jgi:hypothetical protein
MEENNLKHTEKGFKKYNMRDQALMQFFTDNMLEEVRSTPAKVKKPRKKDVGKPQKPRKESPPKIAFLHRDGRDNVPHFSCDAIPALSGYHILKVTPIQVTDEQKAQIAQVRAYLSSKTVSRKARKKDEEKAQALINKQQKLEASVVPTHVPILTMNPAQGQGQGFQSFVPAPNSSVQQAGGQAPPGVQPQQNVNFVPHQGGGV